VLCHVRTRHIDALEDQDALSHSPKTYTVHIIISRDYLVGIIVTRIYILIKENTYIYFSANPIT
jgi:hypothetical protein